MAITNPTPKQRFQESAQSVQKHRAMVDLAEFQRAADFSTLEYQAELSQRNSSMNEAAGNALKMQGAMEFLQVFRNLGETTPPVPRKLSIPQLDHSAS